MEELGKIVQNEVELRPDELKEVISTMIEHISDPNYKVRLPVYKAK